MSREIDLCNERIDRYSFVSFTSLLVLAMNAPIRATASLSGFKSFLQVSQRTVG